MSDVADAPIVTTETGPVRGIVTEEYRLFQGIPYAGVDRWQSALAISRAGAGVVRAA